MLQTIEVEIDATGHIHPLKDIPRLPVGRALLTLLAPAVDAAVLPAQQALSEAWFKPSEEEFDSLCGILKSEHSVSLEDMENAIRKQAQGAMHDCD